MEEGFEPSAPKLIARIRPRIETDPKDAKSTLTSNEGILTLRTEEDDDYYKTFDLGFTHILGQEASQAEVQECIDPLIFSVLHGFECAIMTYGVSKSGKTYTMLGQGPNPGLIPRSVPMIFDAIREYDSELPGERRKYVEEEETIEPDTPLLSTRKPIPTEVPESEAEEISEDTAIPQSVVKLRVFQVWRDHFYQIFETGPKEIPKIQILPETVLRRTKGYVCETATELTSKISLLRSKAYVGPAGRNTRSHFLYVIHPEIVRKSDGPGGYEVTEGILIFADLGGVARTTEIKNKDESEDARFMNASLFQLGRVVEALANRQIKRSTFSAVPLTRILSLALGGECSLGVILNLTGLPGHIAKEETSVLQFGSYMRALKIKPVRRFRQLTREEFERMIRGLEEQIRRLEKDIEGLKKRKSEHKRFIAEGEVRIEQLKLAIDDSDVRLNTMIETRTALLKDPEDTGVDNEVLQANLVKLDTMRKTLLELHELRSSNEDLERDLAKTTDENLKGDQRLGRLEEQLAETKESTKVLEDELRLFQSEWDRYQRYLRETDLIENEKAVRKESRRIERLRREEQNNQLIQKWLKQSDEGREELEKLLKTSPKPTIEELKETALKIPRGDELVSRYEKRKEIRGVDNESTHE